MNNEINPGSGPADATQNTSADRLVQLEDKIGRNFEEAGLALDEINSHQLYKEKGFQTFETYVKKQWGMSKSYAYKLIRAAKDSAQCPIGHKPANVHQALKRRQSSKPAKQPKVEPSKVYLAAEFDLGAELKALEKTVNRLENALCREEYPEAFVHRDCCKLLDHIVGQIENIIIALGGDDEDQREETA
jgi:hypothetical protein